MSSDSLTAEGWQNRRKEGYVRVGGPGTAAQSCGYPIPGGIQGRMGPGQPELVGGNQPTAGGGTGSPLRSPPTQPFCDSVIYLGYSFTLLGTMPIE